MFLAQFSLNYGGWNVTSENRRIGESENRRIGESEFRRIGESDFILQPIRMHNFIISNQSECFIPAATTTVPNVGSENLTFGESDNLTFGESENLTFGESENLTF